MISININISNDERERLERGLRYGSSWTIEEFDRCGKELDDILY